MCPPIEGEMRETCMEVEEGGLYVERCIKGLLQNGDKNKRKFRWRKGIVWNLLLFYWEMNEVDWDNVLASR